MKILNKLTIKHLLLNKKRTIVTIIGIILSTSLMVGIGLLFSTFSDYMIKEIISYNGSYHTEFVGINKDSLILFKYFLPLVLNPNIFIYSRSMLSFFEKLNSI